MARGQKQSILKHTIHWTEGLQTIINADFTCAICESRKALYGFNTLQDLYPDIAKTWNYDSPYNAGLSPGSVTTIYGVKYSWICDECGNSYLATISERINNERQCLYCDGIHLDPGEAQCPYCEGKYAIPGKTSLKALYPKLAVEYAKMNGRNPDNVFPTASTYTFWNCTQCHQTWGSSVADRVNGSSSCPYCDGRKAIPGVTSLETLYPELMSEWNEIANVFVEAPDTVLPNSSITAWWTCLQCNLNYKARIKDRVRDILRSQNSCPHCKGYRRVKHYII